MADTVESLRAELDVLRNEFNTFMAYAKPVVDSHQPPTAAMQASHAGMSSLGAAAATAAFFAPLK